jgi:hypothetical protein
MISLFLGLSTANILLLLIAFGLGLSATDSQQAPTGLYAFHITMGIASGLMATLTHTAVYTYFMATTKWLGAATDKADLDPQRFVTPAAARKARALVLTMAAIAVTMSAMFAGAGGDPTMANPWWPGGVHLTMGLVALVANALAAGFEFPLICRQRRSMDEALAILNAAPQTPPHQPPYTTPSTTPPPPEPQPLPMAGNA